MKFRELERFAMLKFLMKLFGKKEQKSPAAVIEKITVRKNINEPDFIDYDGMGNQGRFPRSKR